jgi:ATP-dependent DNA ligase
MLSEIPIQVFAYDLLELENNDLRENRFREDGPIGRIIIK